MTTTTTPRVAPAETGRTEPAPTRPGRTEPAHIGAAPSGPGRSVTGGVAGRTVGSPIGPLHLTATAAGLRTLGWGDEPLRTLPSGPGADPAAVAVLDRAEAQLAEYFAGERTEFDLPLDPAGTPFQLAAWEALRSIPYGATVSYGEQARRLGDARKARAVGAANGRNPIAIVVPCHRVVGADGSLTGFAGGLETKSWLLDHERRVLSTS